MQNGIRIINREQRELEDGTLVWWFESSVYPGKFVVAALLPNGQEISTLADSFELGFGELLSSLDATVKAMKKLALEKCVLWLTVPDRRTRHV